jgi:hypothetical protein
MGALATLIVKYVYQCQSRCIIREVRASELTIGIGHNDCKICASISIIPHHSQSVSAGIDRASAIVRKSIDHQASVRDEFFSRKHTDNFLPWHTGVHAKKTSGAHATTSRPRAINFGILPVCLLPALVSTICLDGALVPFGQNTGILDLYCTILYRLALHMHDADSYTCHLIWK